MGADAIDRGTKCHGGGRRKRGRQDGMLEGRGIRIVHICVACILTPMFDQKKALMEMSISSIVEFLTW